MPYQYTFGISAVSSDLNAAIHEAVLCMKHRILCPNKSMIYSSDIAAFTCNKMDFSLSDLNDIIARKDQNRLEYVLKSMYRSIGDSFLSYKALQNLYLKILVC